MSHPQTPAIQHLQRENVSFTPHLFEYQEKGGTSVSSSALGVSEHAVVKTLIMKSEAGPMIVLMHGDCKVAVKELARQIGVKKVSPAAVPEAEALSGYLVGGTSPFGTRTHIPVYGERTIFELDRIYINGGKRGFLVEIEPAVLREIGAVDVEVGIGN